MKIKNQYIVSYKNHWQLLYEIETGHYFMTTKGGFGQLDYQLIEIDDKEALKILKDNANLLSVKTKTS